VNRTVVVALALLVCTASPASAEEAPEEAPEEGVNPWYLSGGLLALATGLGLGAAGTYAILQIDSLQEDEGYQRFQDGVPPSIDTCNAARNGIANGDYRLLEGAAFPSEVEATCDELDTLVAVEIIAFPMSIIFAGLGSYLLIEAFGVGHDGDGLALTPTIGPGYAGIGGTF
jgi:hypothetical protein